jgi:hypothetical protein
MLFCRAVTDFQNGDRIFQNRSGNQRNKNHAKSGSQRHDHSLSPHFITATRTHQTEIEGMRVMKIEAPNGASVHFLLIPSENKPSKQEVDCASASAISFPDIDSETNQCVCEVESRLYTAAVAF